MKKLFTVVALAFFAVCGFAQNDTPLELGGGWNNGFAGEADVYSYTLEKQYGAAEFLCNVSTTDYPKYIVEFEDPLPANFQINYTWKESADAEGEAKAAYGRAVGNGTDKKFELTFDSEHPFIVGVSVQHTDTETANLKVKKLTLVAANGDEKKISPSFTTWAGTDNTALYKGSVSFTKQWQQLQLKGVEGKSNLALKVQVKLPLPKVQMCIAYSDDSADYPQFDSNGIAYFTTKKDAVISTVGIQYTESADATCEVAGAWQTSFETVKIPASGYATFVADYGVNYTQNGLTAYAVKVNDDKSTITLNEISGVVPVGVPVLLKGEPGKSYELSWTGGWAVIDTDLKSSDGTITSSDAKSVYGLATVNGEDGFWKATAGKTIPAKCGYLEVDATANHAAFYSLGGGAGTTAIANVKADASTQNAQMYNLAGQAVGNGYKGIVIKNGKKIILK